MCFPIGELEARELLAVTEAPDFPVTFENDVEFTMKVLTTHFQGKYTLISINRACAWVLYAFVTKKEQPLSCPIEQLSTVPQNQKPQFQKILKLVSRNDLDSLTARVKRKAKVDSTRVGTKSRPNMLLKSNQCNNAKRGVLTPKLKSPSSTPPASPHVQFAPMEGVEQEPENPVTPLGPVGGGGMEEGMEEELDHIAKEWDWGYVPPQEAEGGTGMSPAIDGRVSLSDSEISTLD